MEIKQYDIVLINTMPCVVISPDEMNRYLRTVVVAPMTTQSRLIPTRVQVRHNKRTGWIVVDQIRTVDRTRVLRKLDCLTHPEIRKLKSVIRETYVD